MSSEPPDLNALRDFLRAGNQKPATSQPPPTVDREGKVSTTGQPGEDRSQIPTGVFAYSEQEQRDVARYLPGNAQPLTDRGYRGWVYDFENDLFDWYRMFLYYDPRSTLYRVKMIEPPVPERVDPHVAHYFDDGDLCLTQEVGARTLRDAYARSVAFSIGWSWWKRNREFPFNPTGR